MSVLQIKRERAQPRKDVLKFRKSPDDQLINKLSVWLSGLSGSPDRVNPSSFAQDLADGVVLNRVAAQLSGSGVTRYYNEASLARIQDDAHQQTIWANLQIYRRACENLDIKPLLTKQDFNSAFPKNLLANLVALAVRAEEEDELQVPSKEEMADLIKNEKPYSSKFRKSKRLSKRRSIRSVKISGSEKDPHTRRKEMNEEICQTEPEEDENLVADLVVALSKVLEILWKLCGCNKTKRRKTKRKT